MSSTATWLLLPDDATEDELADAATVARELRETEDAKQ